MSDKAKIIKFTETIVKIVIVLLGIWILYKKIIQNQNVTQVWNDIKISFTDKNQFILMIAAFLLVTVNILLEALKWKIQVKPIEDISLGKSYISIFTGMTAGMFFPNRMGNFLGRIFILEKGDRIKAAMVTIVGGFAQMIATVCFGMIALLFFIEKNKMLIFFGIIIIISLLILMYFKIHLLKYLQLFIPKRFKEKTKSYIEIFSQYNKKELTEILIISFARYLLYSFQFVILIWAFNVPLSYINAMIPISLTYLMMMIVPYITITEIAVRGSVSILIFEKWLMMNGINSSLSAMVFSASSLLWIFNIAIPAVIGLFLTNRLKFFRKNEL
ncbi:MAG: flippase-like domain-containing protein [Bacteroidales bacterium]|nr:flippase-like domain-containing protein [Bacteroidales bacterium]